MSSTVLNHQLQLLKNPTQFEVVKLQLTFDNRHFPAIRLDELTKRLYSECGVTCKIVPPTNQPIDKKLCLVHNEIERGNIHCKTCSFLYDTYEEAKENCQHTDKQRGFWITRKPVREINKLIEHGYKMVNLIPKVYGLTEYFRQREIIQHVELNYYLYLTKIPLVMKNNVRHTVKLSDSYNKMKTKYGLIYSDLHELLRRDSSFQMDLPELVRVSTVYFYSASSYSCPYIIENKKIQVMYQVTQNIDDDNVEQCDPNPPHIPHGLEYNMRIDEKWFLRVFISVSPCTTGNFETYGGMLKHQNIENALFNNYMTHLLKHPYEKFDYDTTGLKNFKLTLHDYQVDNLGWMLNIENERVRDTYNLITYRPEFEIVDGLKYDLFADKVQKKRGEIVRIRTSNPRLTNSRYSQYIKQKNAKYVERLNHIKGGLLADIMGAGKTVTCLSLIRYTLDNMSLMNRINYYTPRKVPTWVVPKEFISHEFPTLPIPDTAYKQYYEVEHSATGEKSFVPLYDFELLRQKNEIKNYTLRGLNEQRLYKIRLIEKKLLNEYAYDILLANGTYERASDTDKYSIPQLADIYRSYCIPTNATLIVCPSHMTKHWIEQSKKCSDRFKIVHVVSVLQMRKLSYYDLQNADIVIISYNVLFNDNIAKETNVPRGSTFKDYLLGIIAKMKHLYEGMEIQRGEKFADTKKILEEQHHIKSGINPFGERYQHSMIMPYVERDKIDDTPVITRMKNKSLMPSIFHFIWRRVVFDEFHTDQKVNGVKNSNYLKIYLHSKFRWIISATPNITYSNGTINPKIFDTIKTLLDLNNVGDHLLPSPDRCVFLNRELTSLTLKDITEQHNGRMYNPTNEVMSISSSSSSYSSSSYSVVEEEPSVVEEYDDTYGKKKVDEKFKKGILIPLIMFYKRASSPYGLIKSKLVKRNVYVNQTDKERDLYTRALHGNNIEMLLQLCCHHNVFGQKQTNAGGGEMKAMTIDQAIDMFTNGDIDKLTSLYMEIRDLFTDIEQKQNIGQLKRTDFPVTMSIDQYKKYREILRVNGSYDENMAIIIKAILNSLRKAMTRGKKFHAIKESNEFNISVIKLLESETCTCDICEEEEVEINDMSVLKCGHAFCTECVDNMFNIRRANSFPCPHCRKEIKKEDVYNIHDAKKQQEMENEKEKAQEQVEQLSKDSDDMKFIERYGSKMYTIVNEYLKLLPTDKVIIYSMWGKFSKHFTDVLDLLEIPYRYAWGNVWQTQKAINDFKEDPNVRIIIMSADGKNTGIELLCATHVFMVHPFPRKEGLEAEQQAISRTYRNGQTKDVTVSYFIMRNTIEEQLIESESRHIPNVI
jgi:hypothetical protein